MSSPSIPGVAMPHVADRFLLREVVRGGVVTSISFWFFCPGCQCAHSVPVADENYFRGVDGSTPWTISDAASILAGRPTLSPSLLTTNGQGRTCHSFVREGQIQFLNDCTHPLAGVTVPLPLMPEWLRG